MKIKILLLILLYSMFSFWITKYCLLFIEHYLKISTQYNTIYFTFIKILHLLLFNIFNSVINTLLIIQIILQRNPLNPLTATQIISMKSFTSSIKFSSKRCFSLCFEIKKKRERKKEKVSYRGISRTRNRLLRKFGSPVSRFRVNALFSGARQVLDRTTLHCKLST